MDVFAENDYRDVIRKRVKELAQTRKALTLQKLASLIPVQNTYLSRALNDEKTHLNEDHLFRACKVLEFFPEEIDYLFLLRNRAIASDPDRRSYLESKINRVRQSRHRSAEFQEFDTRRLTEEMAYLFDPVCTVVQTALFIDEYRRNPRKLCQPLGISVPRLKKALTKLRHLHFIELGDDGLTVLKVNQNQVHYGTDHPLMRTHQSLLRKKCSVQLDQAPEEDKQSFMGTFTADEETFELLRKRLREFLKEIEGLVAPAPSRNLYQLNFDLFRWL